MSFVPYKKMERKSNKIGRKAYEANDADRAIVIEMRQKGSSLYEIAKHVSISPTSISKHYKKELLSIDSKAPKKQKVKATKKQKDCIYNLPKRKLDFNSIYGQMNSQALIEERKSTEKKYTRKADIIRNISIIDEILLTRI